MVSKGWLNGIISDHVIFPLENTFKIGQLKQDETIVTCGPGSSWSPFRGWTGNDVREFFICHYFLCSPCFSRFVLSLSPLFFSFCSPPLSILLRERVFLIEGIVKSNNSQEELRATYNAWNTQLHERSKMATKGPKIA